jgi:hypothetical protein
LKGVSEIAPDQTGFAASRRRTTAPVCSKDVRNFFQGNLRNEYLLNGKHDAVQQSDLPTPKTAVQTLEKNQNRLLNRDHRIIPILEEASADWVASGMGV